MFDKFHCSECENIDYFTRCFRRDMRLLKKLKKYFNISMFLLLYIVMSLTASIFLGFPMLFGGGAGLLVF